MIPLVWTHCQQRVLLRGADTKQSTSGTEQSSSRARADADRRSPGLTEIKCLPCLPVPWKQKIMAASEHALRRSDRWSEFRLANRAAPILANSCPPSDSSSPCVPASIAHALTPRWGAGKSQAAPRADDKQGSSRAEDKRRVRTYHSNCCVPRTCAVSVSEVVISTSAIF